MNLIFITPYYPPDLGPSAPLVGTLCERLATMGHNVSVFCTVPNYPSGIVEKEFQHKLVHRETVRGVSIHRIRIRSGDRNNLVHRLYTFLIFQTVAAMALVRIKSDAAMITNPSLETFLPFASYHILKRKPILYCVWDLYPDVGVHLGLFKSKSVIYLITLMENYCLKRSSKIHVLTRHFIERLKTRTHPRKMEVIGPWIDTEKISLPGKENTFSKKNVLVDKFVILYAGNMSHSQGLDTLLHSAKHLSIDDNVRFVFVGEGSNKNDLLELSQRLDLENILFLPYQDKEVLPELLATADIAIVSQIDGIGHDSIPSKSFPIMGAERAILGICEKGSALHDLIQDSQAGISIPPGNPEIISHTIIELLKNREKLKLMGVKGRKYIHCKHSLKAASAQFDSLLNSLSN